MTYTHPLKTGTALAVTVGVAYALCTLIFWLWPEAAANFMNALFHGLDFRRLQNGSSLFSFGSFLYGELVLAGWAFAFGALFGWIARRLDVLGTDLRAEGASHEALTAR